VAARREDERVKDALRRTSADSCGEVEIGGLEGHRGRKLKIAFQNEFLIAERDGKATVTTPDMTPPRSGDRNACHG
jgi:DUF917 family protein